MIAVDFMPIHNSRKKIGTHGIVLFFLFSIFTCVVPVHGTQAAIKAQTVLYTTSMNSGVTIATQAQRFAVGVPAHALQQADPVTISLKRHGNRARYTQKKYTIIGPVWEYTLSSTNTVEVQAPLWISFLPAHMKQNYTVGAWNDTIGKWQHVPYTQTADSHIQLSLQSASAHIAVLKKKKHSKEHVVKGQASWYSATGAAMNDFPIGTHVVVKNVANGKEATTIVESVGPFVEGRIIDLPKEVFEQIGDLSTGVLTVVVKRL